MVMKLSEQLRWVSYALNSEDNKNTLREAADRLDKLEGDDLRRCIEEVEGKVANVKVVCPATPYKKVDALERRLDMLERVTKAHNHKLIIDRISLAEADLSDLTAALEDFVDNHHLYKHESEEKPKTCGTCAKGYHRKGNTLVYCPTASVEGTGIAHPCVTESSATACDKYEAK
jgi:hypothetical protein